MTKPRTFTFLGVFLTSLAVLTLEITLTRVFSVLMWYHFAFMVISLALLGSGAAGVWLYLDHDRFPPERTAGRLALLAGLFAVATAVAFWLYLQYPFEFKIISKEGISWATVGWLALIYLTLSLPFFLGGATIALAISRYSQAVGRLYSYDLVGASLGCLASVLALSYLGAASTVLLVGVLAGVASLLFSLDGPAGRRWLPGLVALALAGVLVSNEATGWLQVRTRGGYDARNVMLYEKWNALSRVTVYEDPGWLQPFGWGLSPTYVGPDPGHLLLLIDANAGTPIQRWDGSWEMVDFLRYDLTSVAYTILPEARTFIIGAGGGRDILTGLLFGARHIVGAELNPAIVTAARDLFGDYAGRVYDQPGVEIAVEDARTYLARSGAEFDLIQASLIDTWAASAAGAYSLSENGLYTREAFASYYRRLSPRGLVSYSRWYYIADPTETLRLVALGLDSWRRAGVVDPARHVVVIANFSQNRSADQGLATLLLKKTPFTPDEVAILAQFSQEMDFTVLVAPGMALPPNPVQDLVTAPDLDQAIAAYPLDISVPTDNRPFFFNFIHFTDLGRARHGDNPAYRASAEADAALLVVLGLATLSALLFIIVPMAVRSGRTLTLRANWPHLLYFAALGVGFMLVMIPSIQRLTVYLGSPTYALAVVLFTILLGSGIGSRATHRVPAAAAQARLRLVIPALILIIGGHLVIIPAVVDWTQAWPFALRVAATVALVFPAGYFMGQPFPLGMKWVGHTNPPVVPWLWAVNGAASVVGSAAATVLGLVAGFRIVSLLGVACYGLALALALVAWRAAAAADAPAVPALGD